MASHIINAHIIKTSTRIDIERIFFFKPFVQFFLYKQLVFFLFIKILLRDFCFSLKTMYIYSFMFNIKLYHFFIKKKNSIELYKHYKKKYLTGGN